jgi:hypothetical protein
VHQDRQRHEQHGGEHKPVPDRDEAAAARVEVAQDVSRGFAQDVRVLEGHRQQGEEHVEGDGRQYQQNAVSTRNPRFAYAPFDLSADISFRSFFAIGGIAVIGPPCSVSSAPRVTLRLRPEASTRVVY